MRRCGRAAVRNCGTAFAVRGSWSRPVLFDRCPKKPLRRTRTSTRWSVAAPGLACPDRWPGSGHLESSKANGRRSDPKMTRARPSAVDWCRLAGVAAHGWTPLETTSVIAGPALSQAQRHRLHRSELATAPQRDCGPVRRPSVLGRPGLTTYRALVASLRPAFPGPR